MNGTLAAVAAVLGVAAGVGVNRAAGRFPWGAGSRLRDVLAGGAAAVRPPVLEGLTGLLCGLAALRFGLSWQLPAFLFVTVTGVLLATVDLRHRLLPNCVVLPSIGVGAALLLLPAAVDGQWGPLLRAGLGGLALFAGFLVLALISPGGMGMGDVKLAGLVGLYLGWLGWPAVVLGAFAGFLVQAVVALGLLAARRIALGGELPFGPSMLVGAALAVGWSALVP